MAEEVKPDTIKKTQTALNKYIKKPPLTDKLLKKPPFRFLHDIVTSVIRETGFLEGVFTPEELIADNVKDRDSKLKFLTKLINAVKDATGVAIKAKPAKIVAGLEVDKTLELLQSIARGITASKNGNGKKITDASKKEKQKPKPKESLEVTENKTENGKIEDEKNKDTSKPSPEEPPIDEPKQLIEETVEPSDNKKKERRKSATKENSIEQKEKKVRGKSAKEEKKEIEEEEKNESFLRTPLIQNGDVETNHGGKGLTLVNGFSEDSTPPDTAVSRRSGRRGSSRESRKSKNSSSQDKVDLPEKESEESPQKENLPEAKDDTPKQDAAIKKEVGGGDAPRRPTTRRASSRSSTTRQPMKAIAEKDSKNESKEENSPTGAKGETGKKTDSLVNGPLTLGSVETSARPPTSSERPRTARRAPPSAARPPSGRPPSARPRSARPPSALPGAPKTRDRGNVEVDINKDKGENEIKEVMVIAENDKEEDKEEMVVVENQSLVLNENENVKEEMLPAMEGVLVDTILETQSELEKKKNKVDIEWDSGTGKDKREAWQKECERLRQGVQALTRSTGPLGKLFDFLQEDVDLATRELRMWRQASATYTSQLAAEERLTEEVLSQHKKRLSELETLIEEQHEANRSLKSTILANDKKIQSLIARPPVR